MFVLGVSSEQKQFCFGGPVFLNVSVLSEQKHVFNDWHIGRTCAPLVKLYYMIDQIIKC